MRITARHKNSEKTLDLYYDSIKEAKKRNPDLIDFEIRGLWWKKR